MKKKDYINISKEAKEVIKTEAWPFEYRLYAQLIKDEIDENIKLLNKNPLYTTEKILPIDLTVLPRWLNEKVDILEKYYLDFVEFMNLDHQDAFGPPGKKGNVDSIIKFAKNGIGKFHKDIMLLNQEVILTLPEHKYSNIVDKFILLTKPTIVSLENYGPSLLREFDNIKDNPDRNSIPMEIVLELDIDDQEANNLLEEVNKIKFDSERQVKKSIQNYLFLTPLNKDIKKQKSTKNESDTANKLRYSIYINGYKNLLTSFIKKYSITGYEKKDLNLLSELLESKGISNNTVILQKILIIEKNNYDYLIFEKNLKFNSPVTLIDYINEFDDNYSLNNKSLYFLLHLLEKENFKTSKDDILKALEEVQKQKELIDFEKKLTESQSPELVNDIDIMTGIEFETFLIRLFQKMGHDVIQTKSTGDQGADLLTQKNFNKYIIQVKRYSSKVGNKAIQEVIAARHYYKIDNAIVITNNYFTKHAAELAKSASIELINRTKLKYLIKKYY